MVVRVGEGVLSSESHVNCAIETPRIVWMNKSEAYAESSSRKALLAWLGLHEQTRLKPLVIARYDGHLTRCILRTRFCPVDQAIPIEKVLADAGFKCEEAPPEPRDWVRALLSRPEKEYEIEGNAYRIKRLISDRGGYGLVFLAVDALEKTVAIKILDQDHDQEDRMLQRLQEHGPHPNIVGYIATKEIWGKRWIVMEYIKGEPKVIYEQKHAWTSDLEKQYQSALTFMWQAGVQTMRENEKENVMITEVDGKPTVKLIDFGTLATN